MFDGFCAVCCTRHGDGEDCPGELRATGPERHGWAVAVEAPRGVEIYGVILGPSEDRWRARIVTYPHAPWTLPGGCGSLKFVGGTPGEAETKALDFILHRCAEQKRAPRDGFGPWDRPDGPEYRRPPPRARRSLPVRYGAGDRRTLSTTANLSPTGMFVLAAEPLPAGTVLDLEIEIFGCVAEMRGTVAWTREKLEAGKPRGMGIRILDPPPVYKLFVRGLN